LKFVRENLELVNANIKNKNEKADAFEIVLLDEKRRGLIAEVECLKMQRNNASKEIAALKSAKHDTESKIAEMKMVSDTIKEKDAKWIEDNIESARELQKNEKFLNAIHCLASYKWHIVPRAQLSMIWAGIEGLFEIESEISFRLSLYISNFLTTGKKKREDMFKKVKKLYNFRSAAVHGSKLKNDIANMVDDSALILRKLILKCINDKIIPDKNNLLFN